MSAREWKPGDVGVLATSDGTSIVAIRDKRGRWAGVDQSGEWYHDRRWDDLARPLVVIDPENREQVERLMDDYDRRVISMHDDPDPREVTPAQRRTAMQAALREFTNPKPPQPEEPTGLGAVVEDAEGALWFRMALDNLTWPGEVWQGQYRDDDRWNKWSDIDAVRVLSEGVTR